MRSLLLWDVGQGRTGRLHRMSLGKLDADLAVTYRCWLTILLKIQENGELEIPLTDDNIKAITLDTFTGGSDNTSSTTEWAMSEMLQNPRVLNKAQEEVRRHPHLFNASKNIVEEANIGKLKYLKLVIKEALRLHPPVAMLVPRTNVERCEIDGYTIPANTKVIINV
ncbi:Desmethyl-deoxy-podophyllotoxin synthase [Linum perenne]